MSCIANLWYLAQRTLISIWPFFFLILGFMYMYAWEISKMLRVVMLCTASKTNLYLLSVCGAANSDFSSHVNWLMWSDLEVLWITYDIAMPLDPTIISKWPMSSIYHFPHWMSDFNYTWKSLGIIISPFLFLFFVWFLFVGFVDNCT